MKICKRIIDHPDADIENLEGAAQKLTEMGKMALALKANERIRKLKDLQQALGESTISSIGYDYDSESFPSSAQSRDFSIAPWQEKLEEKGQTADPFAF